MTRLENFFKTKERDIAIAWLITAIIFVADIFVPFWFNVWLLYFFPMFLMFRSARFPYLFSAAVTFLTFAAPFIPHVGSEATTHALLTRLTGVLTGWGVSFLLMRTRRLHDNLLKSHEERYKKLSESMLEGFARCRMIFEDGVPKDFVYLHVNKSFGRLTGLRDVVGKRVTELIPGIREDYPELFETYGRVATTGKPERFEIYLRPLSAWLSVSAFSSEKDHFVAIFENITERKRSEDELRSMSLTDDLTGLYNRRGFFTLAEKLGKIAKRQKKGMYILYADLDGLKQINDTYGHQEGDLALVAMANILKATCRESDIIARIGGDEFVVIPVGTTGKDTRIVISRLEQNIAAYNVELGKDYELSLSWGVSYFDPANPLTFEELLAEADKMMYERKNNPRKTWEV